MKVLQVTRIESSVWFVTGGEDREQCVGKTGGDTWLKSTSTKGILPSAPKPKL